MSQKQTCRTVYFSFLVFSFPLTFSTGGTNRNIPEPVRNLSSSMNLISRGKYTTQRTATFALNRLVELMVCSYETYDATFIASSCASVKHIHALRVTGSMHDMVFRSYNASSVLLLRRKKRTPYQQKKKGTKNRLML